MAVLPRKSFYLLREQEIILQILTLNIPSLARQRCLPSWGPRRTAWFFVVSQLFGAVDY